MPISANATAAVDFVPPLIDVDHPVEISDGVFVFPDDDKIPLRPNVGVVVGSDAALVVDTGIGPENGERVLSAARRLAGSRKLYLTTTHFHPEHAFGAQAFKRDATIICNLAQRDELDEMGEWYLNRFRTIFNEKVAEMLSGVRFVQPEFVYDGQRSELDLGNKRVVLRNWGKAHTKGDQVVFLPGSRVLFTGDLLENSIFPIFPWLPPEDCNVDGDNWIRVLTNFGELLPRVIVPGHGKVGDDKLAMEVRDFHSGLRRIVFEKHKTGMDIDGITASITPDLVARYGWDQPFWIGKAVQYWCEHFSSAQFTRA